MKVSSRLVILCLLFGDGCPWSSDRQRHMDHFKLERATEEYGQRGGNAADEVVASLVSKTGGGCEAFA